MSDLLAEVAAAGTAVLFSSHQLDLVEDICEDVVIINRGRVVRAGDLEALRAAVPRRFVTISYRGGEPDWRSVMGVEAVDAAAGHVRLQVGPEVDPIAVMAVARRSTDVLSFAYEPPTLSELFRQAVAV
jgi:ABC-2 type transport system ATP-binding protein